MECFNCLAQKGIDEDASSSLSLTIQNLRSVLSTAERGERPQLTSESPEQTAWVRGLMADENVPPIVKLMVCGMKAGDPSGWSDMMASSSWMDDIADELVSELDMVPTDVPWMWRKGDIGWAMGQGVDIHSVLSKIRPSGDTSPIEWPEVYAWGKDAYRELTRCADRTTDYIREFWPDFDPVALLARKGGT